MEKLLKGLTAALWVATFVLFSYWMLDLIDPKISGSPSGWWWFGCLLIGVFTAEIND